MKKVAKKKLQLNRKTIVNLNKDQMGELNGGAEQYFTDFYFCGTLTQCSVTACSDPTDFATNEFFMCTKEAAC